MVVETVLIKSGGPSAGLLRTASLGKSGYNFYRRYCATSPGFVSVSPGCPQLQQWWPLQCGNCDYHTDGGLLSLSTKVILSWIIHHVLSGIFHCIE